MFQLVSCSFSTIPICPFLIQIIFPFTCIHRISTLLQYCCMLYIAIILHCKNIRVILTLVMVALVAFSIYMASYYIQPELLKDRY